MTWYGKACRQLLRTLRESEGLLVLTHENPDPDGIASSAALAYLASARQGLPVTLA